jgi:hypothetical protein
LLVDSDFSGFKEEINNLRVSFFAGCVKGSGEVSLDLAVDVDLYEIKRNEATRGKKERKKEKEMRRKKKEKERKKKKREERMAEPLDL